MQKTILKQQYENFTASRSEGLDKTYDRFQKLISQLEIHDEVISQEDANLKLLRSLPSAWNNIALIMYNKADLDELSMDDLYNNLKMILVVLMKQLILLMMFLLLGQRDKLLTQPMLMMSCFPSLSINLIVHSWTIEVRIRLILRPWKEMDPNAGCHAYQELICYRQLPLWRCLLDTRSVGHQQETLGEIEIRECSQEGRYTMSTPSVSESASDSSVEWRSEEKILKKMDSLRRQTQVSEALGPQEKTNSSALILSGRAYDRKQVLPYKYQDNNGGIVVSLQEVLKELTSDLLALDYLISEVLFEGRVGLVIHLVGSIWRESNDNDESEICYFLLEEMRVMAACNNGEVVYTTSRRMVCEVFCKREYDQLVDFIVATTEKYYTSPNDKKQWFQHKLKTMKIQAGIQVSRPGELKRQLQLWKRLLSIVICTVRKLEDTPESELPPCKRLCLTALTSRYKVWESSTAAPRPAGGHGIDYGFIGTLDAETRRQRAEEVGYGIRDTWVDPREAAEEIAPVTLEGVNTRVTELAAVQEQDTQDIYAVIEDAQDRQTRIFQSVETLIDDRQYHYETARLLDQEALVSREAWAHTMGLSSAVHYELQGYRTHAWMQDHRIDAQDSLIAALTAQVSSLQGHLATALGEIRALQARDQARADAPEGTGSSA
ncbi:hypothetical protein Tco_0732665 [Tanacetum coccineum]